MKRFHIQISEFRRLHGRAYRAQQKNHFEVTGVLILNGTSQLSLKFLPNQENTPGKFSLNPIDVQGARREARKEGKKIVGFFHSHPVSEAIPGPNDRKNAPLNSLQMIYDVCGREARIWRIYKSKGRRRVKEIPLDKK